MSIGAELGQYILQTQFKKNSEDSMGGNLNAPSGYAGGLTESYGKSGQPAEVNVW